MLLEPGKAVPRARVEELLAPLCAAASLSPLAVVAGTIDDATIRGSSVIVLPVSTSQDRRTVTVLTQRNKGRWTLDLYRLTTDDHDLSRRGSSPARVGRSS